MHDAYWLMIHIVLLKHMKNISIKNLLSVAYATDPLYLM